MILFFKNDLMSDVFDNPYSNVVAAVAAAMVNQALLSIHFKMSIHVL